MDGFHVNRVKHGRTTRIVCGLALAAWVFLGAGGALAEDDIDPEFFNSHRFAHKDWDLACDNTRTCRAAGYQAEEGLNEPVYESSVSLRITRVAGPNTPVAIALRIPDSNKPTSYRLRAGTLDLRGLKKNHNWQIELTPEQSLAVMTEMLKDREPLIWFGDDASGDPDGRLSLAGLNAVLLKMDEWQGRVGTPGALIRRGSKPESSVLPPLPMPVVKVAAPVATQPADADLVERILPSLVEQRIIGDCYVPYTHEPDEQELEKYFKAKLNAGFFSIHRLTNRRLLLSLLCSGYRPILGDQMASWIVNDRPPYEPQFIEARGEFDAKTMSISDSRYTRLNAPDCWTFIGWHFNGQKFFPTYVSSNADPCRDYFSGWPLETYVTNVVYPKPASSEPQKP
ncbi:MAG: DUF1176 domain-containing protein [Betaproteobacteria bacterium]|nr:DUF1176 domain-containing protein [Betaproteobacteria bacterium]